MTSRARARVAGVVGRPDLEGAEVWLLHHYDRDARWLTRNIITQEEIALRECNLSAPTPIGCCQGLPEELLEMAFVSGHAEAPPFVLCTVARVCSTLRTLVALRYPRPPALRYPRGDARRRTSQPASAPIRARTGGKRILDRVHRARRDALAVGHR